MMSAAAGSVLVLGLGNDILTDDAVGLEVVREVGDRLHGEEGIDVRCTMEMGLALLDEITGYAALVLVDAVKTGRATPGHLHEMAVRDLEVLRSVTPHFLGIGETLALGRLLHLPMPGEVRIFGIEVQDTRTLGTALTAGVSAAVPGIIDSVVTAARAERARLDSEARTWPSGGVRKCTDVAMV